MWKKGMKKLLFSAWKSYSYFLCIYMTTTQHKMATMKSPMFIITFFIREKVSLWFFLHFINIYIYIQPIIFHQNMYSIFLSSIHFVFVFNFKIYKSMVFILIIQTYANVQLHIFFSNIISDTLFFFHANEFDLYLRNFLC